MSWRAVPAFVAIAGLFALAGCVSEKRVTPECAAICGKVIDAKTRAPISHFTIAVFSADPVTAGPRYALPPGYPIPPGPLIESHAIDSPAGTFNVDPGAAKAVFIGIAATGYKPAQTDRVASTGRRLQISLIDARRIRGHVVDEQGRAIENAALYFDHPREILSDVVKDLTKFPAHTRTNARGDLDLDEPYLPTTDVVIVKESFLPQRVTVNKEAATFNVVLREGVRVDGTVVCGDEQPASGAAIEARCENYEPVRTFSRPDGTFFFTALPRSLCQFIASRTLVEQGNQVGLDPIRGSAEMDLHSAPEPVHLVIPR